MSNRFLTLVNLISLALGAILLVVLVVQLDADEVAANLLQVGWYFALSFGLYVLNMGLTAAAWRLVVDPAESQASFRQFFAAFWSGSAVNQLAPTLGEVVKGANLRGLVGGEELTASIITMGFLNKAVKGGFMILGSGLCLLVLALPREAMWVVFGAALALYLPVFVVYLLLRWGLASRVIALIARLPLVRFRDPDKLRARAQSVDRRIRGFRRSRPLRFWSAVGLLIGVRLVFVLDAFVLLTPLLPEQDSGFVLLLAVLAQSAVMAIALVATFIPGQIGVSEGGLALLFELLGLDPLTGFAMRFARRLRKMVGIGIGLLLGMRMGTLRRRRARAAAETAARDSAGGA